MTGVWFELIAGLAIVAAYAVLILAALRIVGQLDDSLNRPPKGRK